MARSKFCAVLLVTVAVVLITKAEAGGSMNEEEVSQLIQKSLDEYQTGEKSRSNRIEMYEALESRLTKVKGDLAQENFDVVTSKGKRERMSASRLKKIVLGKRAELQTALNIGRAYELYLEGISALGDPVMRDLRKADKKFDRVRMLMWEQELYLKNLGLEKLVDKKFSRIKGKGPKLSCVELKRMTDQKSDEVEELFEELYKVSSEMFKEAVTYYKKANLAHAKKVANVALMKLGKAPQTLRVAALEKNLERIAVLDGIPEFEYGDMSKDPEYDTYQCDIDFMRAPCRDNIIAWTACATHHARFLRFLDRKEPISGVVDFGLRAFGSVDAKGAVTGYVNSDEEDAVANEDGCLNEQWEDDSVNGRTKASLEVYKEQRQIVYTHWQEGRTFDPMASAVLQMFFDLNIAAASPALVQFFGAAAVTLFGLATTYAEGGGGLDYAARAVPGTAGVFVGGAVSVEKGIDNIKQNTNAKRRERNNKEAERVNKAYRLEEE